MVGDLELIGQTRNFAGNALLQIVRRAAPVNGRAYDPDDSGEYGLVYSRFLYCPGNDSLLDASTGQILDVRISTANLEERLARQDARQAQLQARQAQLAPAQLTEEERELADQNDFRHGVAPDRVTSPVSFLNLTTSSGHSTLYVEEDETAEVLAGNTAYDYAEVFNHEEDYNKAYMESFYINYSDVSIKTEEKEENNSSWSHVSPTSLLASRPWPRLPPLPPSEEDVMESFENKANDNVRVQPATPTSWTGLMEGSFMASLDQQRSPMSDHSDLEPIIPTDPKRNLNTSTPDNVTVRTAQKSASKIPRPSAPRSGRRATSRVLRPEFLQPPGASNNTVVMTTVGTDDGDLAFPVMYDDVADDVTGVVGIHVITRDEDLDGERDALHHAIETEQLPPTPTHIPASAPTPAPAADYNNVVFTTTAGLVPIPSPLPTNTGVPGLKRRRLSSPPATSSSSSSPESLPRRSRRIMKRKPRRRHAK